MTAERQAELENQLQNGVIEDQDMVALLVEAYGHEPEAAQRIVTKGRFVDDDGRACYV